MTIDGTLLLRRLEPAVRAAGELPGRAIGTIETQDFAALLEQVDRGAMASGGAADASALRDPPGPAELVLLGEVLDVLAARGVRRALIVYGARPLVADVASRRIEQELSAQDSPDTPVAVDAAVRVSRMDDPSLPRFVGPSAASQLSLRHLTDGAAAQAARHSQSELRSAPGRRPTGS